MQTLTLQQQVCSIELAKKLKELSVEQESFFIHTRYKITFAYEVATYAEAKEWRCYDVANTYSAYTVTELGEMLPHFVKNKQYSKTNVLKINKRENTWVIEYHYLNYQSEDSLLANAMSKMLIYLLENKLITL
jgi:hypothetical protein